MLASPLLACNFNLHVDASALFNYAYPRHFGVFVYFLPGVVALLLAALAYDDSCRIALEFLSLVKPGLDLKCAGLLRQAAEA